MLTPESVAEILTPVPFTNAANSSHISGLGFDLFRVNGELVGARKTGDHRGFKPIMVMDLKHSAGIVIMANSDRAAIGFVIDIACAWSEGVTGNPMQSDCGELRMIRNIQLILGGMLALGALIYGAFIVRDVLNGRRRFDWTFSRSQIIRAALLGVVLVTWWVGWHTDTLLTRIVPTYPCCGYAVTVRAFVPWPTAFVWISWGVTCWLLAWIAVVFTPKTKTI